MIDYHRRYHTLESAPKDSLHFQEGQRRLIGSEKLALEIAKAHESICELIGTIKVLFHNTPELIGLTKNVSDAKSLDVPEGKTDNLNLVQLECYRIEVHEAIHKPIKQQYVQPIDNLIDYLAHEIATR